MSPLVISSNSTITTHNSQNVCPPNENVNIRRKTDQVNEENLPQFLTSIQNLLLKYRMYSKSSNQHVTSGGLQQLISRKMKEQSDSFTSPEIQVQYSKTESVSVSIHSDTDDNNLFHCLPVDLKLHIFSYLDTKTLCMACCVSQEWSQLTCDELLWQRLLRKDMRNWSKLSHLTNPKMYLEVNSEWSSKEIYLRCSPEFHKHLRRSNSTFHQVSSLLKYLFPKRIPKVAMFGPGLEQSTSGLVRRILYEENKIFTRVAMFPGQFDGVGGGITLKLHTGHSLHLSVLYSATQQERENRGAQARLQKNKMLQRQVEEDAAENDEPLYELKPQIKHLCHTLDGLIYVIDASEPKDTVAKCRGELMAMLRERRSAPHIPVLILSCVKQTDSPRLPACDIVDILQLSSILQPWLVIDCVSDTLHSVDTGVIWLVDQSQFK